MTKVSNAKANVQLLRSKNKVQHTHLKLTLSGLTKQGDNGTEIVEGVDARHYVS